MVQDPVVLFCVSAILARRLDSANQAVLELKAQLQVGKPPSVISKTVERIEELLTVSGANLVYAGYPTDPFA
jgi:hypothetical protein